MAIFYLRLKTIGAKQGSIVKAAAYRSGEKSYRDKTDEHINYTRKQGVIATGIIAPDNAPDWTYQRQLLWNAVEAAEKRKDARYGREMVLALPHELDYQKNQELVEEYIKENFTLLGMVADYAIHIPSSDFDLDDEGNVIHLIDQRNIHVHILLTDRPLDGDQFSTKKDRSWNDKELVEAWRENWAKSLNRKLKAEDIDHPELDHRSYKRQGSEKEAQKHEGKTVTAFRRKKRGFDKDRYSYIDSIITENDLKREINKVTDDIAAIQEQNNAPDKQGSTESKPHKFQDWIDAELPQQELTKDDINNPYQLEPEPPPELERQRSKQTLKTANDNDGRKSAENTEIEALQKAYEVQTKYRNINNRTPKTATDEYRMELARITAKNKPQDVAKDFRDATPRAMNYELLIRSYLKRRGFNEQQIRQAMRTASPALYKKSQEQANFYARKFNNYLLKFKRDLLKKQQQKREQKRQLEQQKKRGRKR